MEIVFESRSFNCHRLALFCATDHYTTIRGDTYDYGKVIGSWPLPAIKMPKTFKAKDRFWMVNNYWVFWGAKYHFGTVSLIYFPRGTSSNAASKYIKCAHSHLKTNAHMRVTYLVPLKWRANRKFFMLDFQVI